MGGLILTRREVETQRWRWRVSSKQHCPVSIRTKITIYRRYKSKLEPNHYLDFIELYHFSYRNYKF